MVKYSYHMVDFIIANHIIESWGGGLRVKSTGLTVYWVNSAKWWFPAFVSKVTLCLKVSYSSVLDLGVCARNSYKKMMYI